MGHINHCSVLFCWVHLSAKVRELWLAMGRRALECLDISWAKKAYRQAPAAGMVMYLDRIQTVEDKLLLSGHVSALFGDFAKAVGKFLTARYLVGTVNGQTHQ